MASRKYQKLSDGALEAVRDFFEEPRTFWDTQVRGLAVRVGKRKTSFFFQREFRKPSGKKGMTFKTFPDEYPIMKVADARREASILAGRIADGKREPSKREALKFGAALDDYLKFLRAKAAKKDKPARHAANVEKLRKQFFEEFEKWPLAALSNDPGQVKEWHEKITDEAGPISANRAAEVMRACYRFARRGTRGLPPDDPTSKIIFNTEIKLAGRKVALALFPKWSAAWHKIESPTRRAFHLVNLLTGCRPGELARLKRADILPRDPERGFRVRAFVIRNAKAGRDISIMLSIPIVRALRLALADHSDALVFPGCAQVGHRDALPARGVELRRAYRTVAAALEIDAVISHFLMGHAPEGISQRYIDILTLQSLPAMRSAQRKISARILELLGMTLADIEPEPWH